MSNECVRRRKEIGEDKVIEEQAFFFPSLLSSTKLAIVSV